MMDKKEYVIGVDIGGQHISSCLVDLNTYSIVPESFYECKIDSKQAAFSIVQKWSHTIKKTLAHVPEKNTVLLGIAIPGPFDYKNGVSKMLNVDKYESLYSLNIKQCLSGLLDIAADNIHFINDASAFALGEYFKNYALKYKKLLGLTLGTGFGSTYIHNGIIQPKMLYDVLYKDSIADDYFSTRWLVDKYNDIGSEKIKNVKQLAQLAEKEDTSAVATFQEFGTNLGQFLSKILSEDDIECCVFGGNISRAWDFFAPHMKKSMNGHTTFQIERSNIDTNITLIGAAYSTANTMLMNSRKRKTTQFLLPEKTIPTPQGSYDIYPGLTVAEDSIQTGYKELAEYIETQKTVVIDGYIGVFWKDLCNGLSKEFKQKGVNVLWHNVDATLKNSSEIDTLIAPYLGGTDPIFGKKADLRLADFFEEDRLQYIKADSETPINILYGTGAALCKWNAPLIYVDVPKNELQFRMRAKAITNLGADEPTYPKAMYKRFYFVDWVVLNNHKQQLVSDIAIIVDDQRPNHPFWTTGNCMRESLKKMSENCFRVRPWFEPGVWGGTWIKDNIDQLSKEVPNYAWSFELIVPENGLMLEDGGKMLEFSFDFLMFQEYKNVLGEAADFFGYEFPIRFDYLDTFDGANLSIQVHPKQKYFVREFGENFTQDECYYMLDVKDGADVYIGFQDDIDPIEFRQELEGSAKNATAVDIPNYVQAIKANKHDLFLIPAGTIHGSGKNNLVLEISATPYIFTFKLYDWLRLDLDGKPRPLNLERGFKNLDFNRKGDVIQKEFIAHPKILEQGMDWHLVHLPTHPDHFYDVYRYEFDTAVKISTNNQCHVLALVEGTSVTLETEKGMRQRFNFGETFVVAAACGTYTLTNESGARCKVIKSFVKSEKVSV